MTTDKVFGLCGVLIFCGFNAAFASNTNSTGALVIDAIQANQQMVDRSYIEVEYTLSMQQHGKTQREYYSTIKGFPQDIIASLSPGDSRSGSTIRLRTFGSQYWFHKIETDDQDKVVANFRVIFDGSKTREIQYKTGMSRDKALLEKEPSLDLTKKKRAAHLIPSESPFGFLLENIGCREGLVKHLQSEVTKEPKIKWLQSEKPQGQFSLSYEDVSAAKNVYTFDANQSFLPKSYTKTMTNGVLGEVSAQYSKTETNGMTFWYPANVKAETYWMQKDAKKMLIQQILKVEKVHFVLEPPAGAFNVSSSP
jgi:hypothetical protein